MEKKLKLLKEKVSELNLHIQNLIPSRNLQELLEDIKKHENMRNTIASKGQRMFFLFIIFILSILIFTNLLIGKSFSFFQISGVILFLLGLARLHSSFKASNIKTDLNNMELENLVILVEKKYAIREKMLNKFILPYTCLICLSIGMIIFDYIKIIDNYWGIIGIAIGLIFAVANIIEKILKKQFNENEKMILSTLKDFAKTS